MNHLILRDDQHALVLVDLDLSVLHITWREPESSDVLRRILIQGYMQALQHDIKHVLTDSRSMHVISDEDEHWIRTDLIPRMFQLGVKRVAIVESEDPLHNEQIERLAAHAASKLPYPVQHFAEMDHAFDWMLTDETAAA